MKILVQKICLLIILFFTFSLTVYASDKTTFNIIKSTFSKDLSKQIKEYAEEINNKNFSVAQASLREIKNVSLPKDTNLNIINKEHYYQDLNEYTLEKVQYIPPYYSQNDNNWADIYYGPYTLRESGCVPTSLAMAFQAILKRQVLPTEIADYLYYQTDTFNKNVKGSTNLAIIKAANAYNVKVQGVNTIDELIQTLNQGKIIIAPMSNGKYATNNYQHAIVLYKYANGKTNVYDALNIQNNTLEELNYLWYQKDSNNIFYALGN